MRDVTFEPEIGILSSADCPRRRNWSDAEKIRIVEESLVGSRQVTATARRNGVSRSLLTVWRRHYREGRLGARRPAFIPVAIASEARAEPDATKQSAAPDDALGSKVEIILPNGRRLVVPASVEPSVLSGILDMVDS